MYTCRFWLFLHLLCIYYIVSLSARLLKHFIFAYKISPGDLLLSPDIFLSSPASQQHKLRFLDIHDKLPLCFMHSNKFISSFTLCKIHHYNICIILLSFYIHTCISIYSMMTYHSQIAWPMKYKRYFCFSSVSRLQVYGNFSIQCCLILPSST